MIIALVLVFMYSVYTLFVASDGLHLAMGLLRVALSILGLISLRFDHETMLYTAFFMYAITTLSLFGVMRNEVQGTDE